MTLRRPLAALLLAALACGLFPAGAAAQVTVRQVDWGFGGKATPGQFTPVSILLDNPTNDTFDGVVNLYRANFVGERRGAVLTEPVFLSAFASRRVQFYVIPLDGGESWRLEAIPDGLAAGDDGVLTATLPRPGLTDSGDAGVVFLTGPDDFTARVPGLPRMDETLFPPRPEATEGLRGVVLDHAPNWADAQQNSFMAWLNAGGAVHLLTAPDGSPVRFRGAMTPLNDPTSRFAVGRGAVLRHAQKAGAVAKPFVDRTLLPDPSFARMTAEDLTFEQRREQQTGAYPVSYQPTRLEEEILPTLRRMVRPEHNWGLIHILCLAYVAALFPGVFLVGRERRGYPATLGLLIAVTLTFGIALRTVGRRGYGESLSVRTTALVRALPPGPGSEKGATEVTQWADAFVTDGGDYTFAVAGPASLYSTGQASEPVKGTIRNGVDGSLTADVPPFSSRAFVAKVRREEPAPAVELLAGSSGATTDGTGVRLTGLRLKVPPELVGRAKLFAVHHRHVYPLNVSGGTAAINPNADPIPLGNLLAGYGFGLVGNVTVQAAPYGEGNQYNYGMDPYQQYGWEDAELTDRGLDLAARQLIGRDLGFENPRQLYRLSAPADRVRIYAVTPLRDEHRILGAAGRERPTEPLPNQNGTTILSYEFPL
ncbi:hypothetical protein [Alienimonas californiensis]|uniref:Uncharacterized protein n=1 Tax=Alienimonas californiensis TaxID=2527989 RepID=A0A517PC20_9PLAN|nr:hypothetical protein [Alienimonas californiensis]QDT16925.1 hypothetical protein CA12_30340 [Alienimonas californiensis]